MGTFLCQQKQLKETKTVDTKFDPVLSLKSIEPNSKFAYRSEKNKEKGFYHLLIVLMLIVLYLRTDSRASYTTDKCFYSSQISSFLLFFLDQEVDLRVRGMSGEIYDKIGLEVCLGFMSACFHSCFVVLYQHFNKLLIKTIVRSVQSELTVLAFTFLSVFQLFLTIMILLSSMKITVEIDNLTSFRLRAVAICFRSPSSVKRKKKCPRENWGRRHFRMGIFFVSRSTDSETK